VGLSGLFQCPSKKQGRFILDALYKLNYLFSSCHL
jgi:hypothetical protein